ncbi:MAG: AGE family epimerase/isomerase [Bacteroidales bacterium]|nr:AGE family epimerase/isomerase [Bacteroidales bacterium]
MDEKLKTLKEEARAELVGDILPFWMERMRDKVHGGFLGRISGDGEPDATAPKGAILSARILWTFSSAYRILGDQTYLETAAEAKDEILGKFYDKEFGGVYWSLNPDGTPADAKKQTYALAFALYGLAEYHRATGDKEALNCAVRLFRDIEDHAKDDENNGYYEAYARDWGPIEDMRLSEKDRNDCKSMNTHLHILEAYTALYRVWKDPKLETRLRSLIFIHTNKLLDPDTWHLGLFFNEVWDRTDTMVSYGHDIEASWLLWEAAEVLGDEKVKTGLKNVVLRIAAAALEGYVRSAGMLYEADLQTGSLNAERQWWVQAETVVGCVNAWQLSQSTAADATGPAMQPLEAKVFLATALDCWNVIQAHIIDRQGGEWFWGLRPDGTPETDNDKAGFWKCPYHNSRMCMELIERL